MLEYLEIKDFPSEVGPLLQGAKDVVSWWRAGQLAERQRDALLIGGNAGMYALGMGADWFTPPLIGASGGEGKSQGDAIAGEIEARVAACSPSEDGTVKAVNPLLILQIAQLVMQLLKSLKS